MREIGKVKIKERILKLYRINFNRKLLQGC